MPKLHASIPPEHPNRDLRALKYAGAAIVERGSQHGHMYAVLDVGDVMRFRRTWERYADAPAVRIKPLDPAVRWIPVRK